MEEGPGFHRSSGGQFKEDNGPYYFHDGDIYESQRHEGQQHELGKLIYQKGNEI